MKPLQKTTLLALAFIGGISLFPNIGRAQSSFIKDLKKTAEESAKRSVERNVDQKTSEAADKAFESVMESPNIFKSKKNRNKTDTGDSTEEKTSSKSPESSSKASSGGDSNTSGASNLVGQFIPNGQVMYTDNFERDAIGDFPSRWETNSGGEIITIDDFKALRTSGTGFYTPMLPEALPDNYALEFDLFTYNLTYKTTTPLRFAIHLVEEPLISKAKKGAEIEMPLWYKGASDYFLVETYGMPSKISNKIPYNYTEKLNDLIHFTLVKNGKRVRVFLDDTKVVDIPSLASEDLGKYIQFYVREVDLQKDLVVAIANLQITEEGEDLRSKLMKAEGFSTTSILFKTGSDQLQASSFEFLNQLGEILKADESLRIQIIGHTDSDGDAQANQELSEKRAAAVSYYLNEKFDIETARFQIIGKGESEPINSNNSAADKAANRRVEFKKF